MKLQKQSRLLLFAIAVLLAQVLQAGCWDRRELEDQAFVQAMGLDKAEDNLILVTFRIAIPSKSGLGQTAGGGGGEGGSQAAAASLLTVVAAPTVPAAAAMASGYVNRELNLMHVKAIVFGESLAKEGISQQLDLVARHRELRRNIFMCVTRGEAHELLKNNQPDLEKSYAKYWEGVKMLQYLEALHPGTVFQEFVTDAEALTREGTMIYLAHNSASKASDIRDISIPPSFREGRLGVKAGEIPRIGGNPVEYIGTAVFRNDKLSTVLNLTETRSLLMLSGNFRSCIYTVPDPLSASSYISLELKQGSPPIIKVDTSGEKVQIRTKLSLEGDLVTVQGRTDFATKPDKQKLLESAVAADIKHRSLIMLNRLREQGTDAVGFGDFARKQFLTMPQWQEFNWPEKFRDAEILLDVRFSIRRTGTQGSQPLLLRQKS